MNHLHAYHCLTDLYDQLEDLMVCFNHVAFMKEVPIADMAQLDHVSLLLASTLNEVKSAENATRALHTGKAPCT